MQDVLKTQRLVLRRPVLSDAQPFADYANDIDIARMTSTFPHPFPLLSVEFKIMFLRARWLAGSGQAYAICDRRTDAFMGIVDLMGDMSKKPPELAYWVGRPFWNKGYASEACRAILAELRASKGPRVVTAGIYTDNPASGRVLEKLGFTPDGTPVSHFSMARLASHPVQSYRRAYVS